MKKRTGILAVLLMAAGCTKPDSALKEMKIHLDTEAGAPMIRWEKLEEGDVSYQIVMRTVSGKDGGAAGNRIGEETVSYESYSGMNWIARYADQNDYYGPMQYQVTASINNTSAYQGYSDIFMIQEYFPSEKEKTIDADTVCGITYSGTGETKEQNFIFDIREEDGTYILMADFSDEEKRHEINKEVSEDVLQEIRRYVENGKIVRRVPADPELVILDGSEERFQVYWNEETDMEKNWYEFLPADSDTDALKAYLIHISKEE